jgi:hypothetical protein
VDNIEEMDKFLKLMSIQNWTKRILNT